MGIASNLPPKRMAKFLKKGLLLSVVLVLGCTFSGMSSPVSLAGLKDEEVSRCAELCRSV